MLLTILIELKASQKLSFSQIEALLANHNLAGFELDQDYAPVLMNENQLKQGKMTVLVRAFVESEKIIEQIKELEGVVAVWNDTMIAPFTDN